MAYRELEVTLGKHRGIVVKVSDGFVWVKFEEEDNLIKCEMKDIEIVYEKLEAIK